MYNTDTVSVCLVCLLCAFIVAQKAEMMIRAMCGNVWQRHITGKQHLAAIETGAAMLYWPSLRSFRLQYYIWMVFGRIHSNM